MIVLRRVLLTFGLALLLVVTLSGGNAFALTRTAVVKRAQAWTNTGVPYSQARRYLGYRADCSGFVSYALGVPAPGATTTSLYGMTRPISKTALQPGDVMLSRGHAVLFGGWANRQRTRYIAFEQSSSRGGVRRETPYPYWNGSYGPRRHVGISGLFSVASLMP